MTCEINKIIVQASTVCDFVPVVSTVTNSVVLVAKAAFKLYEKCFDKSLKLSQNAVVCHIRDKSIIDCIVLMIPFINVFFEANRNSDLLKDLQNKNERLVKNLEFCIEHFVEWDEQNLLISRVELAAKLLTASKGMGTFTGMLYHSGVAPTVLKIMDEFETYHQKQLQVEVELVTSVGIVAADEHR